MSVKGHPLLWGFPGLGWPARHWRDTPPPDAQLAYVHSVLERFGNPVRLWDVVNEPTHFPAIRLDDAYRAARAAAPKAHLIVNDYSDIYDSSRTQFLCLLTDAMARGVPFDGVGLQAHEPPGRAYPLQELTAALDRFAALGKRIHLTELAFQSDMTPVTGSPWLGRWSETVQADYVEMFYRVAFAHPAVDSIIWWVVVPDHWRPGAELLRPDLSPKPVFARLDRLLNTEWRTNLDMTTDSSGVATFEGFHGEYDVTIALPGVMRKERITVDQRTSRLRLVCTATRVP